MRTLDLLLAAISIASFVGFTWAFFSLFKRPVENTFDARLRLLRILAPIFFIAQLSALIWPAGQSYGFAIAGFILYIISLSLFWWTIPIARRHSFRLAFSKDAPDILVAEGPYRWIRHPFYVAYMLFWVAGVVASQRSLLAVSVVAMGWIYLSAIREEERKFLSGPLSNAYREYMSRVGMLIPKLF